MPGLHAGRRVARHRQRGDDGQARPFRVRQRVHQARQVVFQEPRALGREQRDRLAVVGAVAPGQAEVGGLSRRAHLDAAQAFRHRLILGGGEGLGTMDLQLQLAVGQGDVALQRLAHPAGVVGELGAGLRQRFRAVVSEDDRLLDVRQDLARAGAQRVQAVLGQVQAHVRQRRRGQPVDGQEGGQRGGDGERAPKAAAVGVHRLLRAPSSRRA